MRNFYLVLMLVFLPVSAAVSGGIPVFDSVAKADAYIRYYQLAETIVQGRGINTKLVAAKTLADENSEIFEIYIASQALKKAQKAADTFERLKNNQRSGYYDAARLIDCLPDCFSFEKEVEEARNMEAKRKEVERYLDEESSDIEADSRKIEDLGKMAKAKESYGRNKQLQLANVSQEMLNRQVMQLRTMQMMQIKREIEAEEKREQDRALEKVAIRRFHGTRIDTTFDGEVF